VQLRLEFLFKAAEAVVVHTDVAEHLRGDLVVRIEALELLLKVEALHGESLDACGNAGGDATRDPGEAVAFVEARENLLLAGLGVVGVGVDDGGQSVRGSGLVFDLVGTA